MQVAGNYDALVYHLVLYGFLPKDLDPECVLIRSVLNNNRNVFHATLSGKIACRVGRTSLKSLEISIGVISF